MQREFVSVRVGVMMVSDAPTTLDEATVKSIVDRLTTAGHTVTPIEVIKDDSALVRAQLERWIRDAEMDVVIALAGFESDAVPTALTPLITKQVAGFSEMFRVLTYNEIGTAAMLTDVIAAQCGATFVFVLPASKGAVATAVHKLLIPQLDARTMPRNLVMRMPRHRSPSGSFESSGPRAFPKEDTSPASVPPPPRPSKSSISPPPVPRGRAPSALTSVVVDEPPVVSRTTSDPSMEIDPAMMVEEAVPPAVNRTLEEALEQSIERSIEASIESTGKALVEAPKLEDDHPSMVAAREHAEKTPEAQAAAWVAAVEVAATKAQQKAVAEREAREAKRAEAPSPVPEPVDEVDAAAVIDEKVDEKKAVGSNDEPRGKIEKASGKPLSKPDRAVKDEDAVIVEDPDLVAAEKRLRPSPSMQPANKTKEPDLLLFPRVKEPEVSVFGAREAPPQQRTNRGWMLIGGIAVIAAVVLIVLALGKRDGTSAAATDPNVGQLNPPPPTGPTAPANNPPVDPNPNPNAVDLPGSNSDIEMEPQTHVNDPKPPKLPRPPRGSQDPKGPDPDDPDLTKAPTNPTTADECDEVTCILNKFSKPCCERYKPADWKPPVAPGSGSDATTPKAPDNAGPIELDKTLIRVGVERFRAQVIACGEQSQAKGTVKIDVSVRPDGMVDSASVADSPDPVLGNCVAGVMRKATFAKTQKGGTFSYPFVF